MLRFAPSPTADMHIESLRVAILNYIVAKQKNDQYIVRIEDREKERNIEGKDTEILQILEKFAIQHDRVFHQSENLHMHQTLAIRLLEEGKAFACICTDRELDSSESKSKKSYVCSGGCQEMSRDELARVKSDKIPFVIRLKRPSSTIVYHDLIAGDMEYLVDDIDSFVILQADGTPTYNFACACDDMLTGVDFIIRSQEYLEDTPKQIYIKELLGYDGETTYAHLPAILDNLGEEIGRSDDTISLVWLLSRGYIPDAIINYLILMGNDTPEEIFTLPEAIEWFRLEAISKNRVKFEIDKLRSINSQHLKMMDDKRLSSLFGFADGDIGRLAKLYLKDASTVGELESKIKPIFAPKDFSGEWGDQMRILESIISNLPFISEFDKFQEILTRESRLKGDNFSKPLRILLTGADDGPELSDIYPYIKSYLLEIIS
ncbi:Glutamyl-tRNA(Gln) synthetase [hydrothermal vent metagenome]|uniref:Glutamyl-tRNA(Gln) synthetase n=1 Tax=hydrothermal vent metagenome TaxID=652676 RepID=A0A1W1B8C7_9ZZZZ